MCITYYMLPHYSLQLCGRELVASEPVYRRRGRAEVRGFLVKLPRGLCVCAGILLLQLRGFPYLVQGEVPGLAIRHEFIHDLEACFRCQLSQLCGIKVVDIA